MWLGFTMVDLRAFLEGGSEGAAAKPANAAKAPERDGATLASLAALAGEQADPRGRIVRGGRGHVGCRSVAVWRDGERPSDHGQRLPQA
jgi:hypothetical protein